MADILDTVGIEIESGTKNVSSSVDRVIQDLQNLNSTIKSTSNFTDKLRENFSKLGVNLDGSKLKSTLSSLSSDTLKYNTTSGQTVTVVKKVKNGMDDLKVSVRNVNNEVSKSGSVWSRFTSSFSKIGREVLTIFGITKGAMTLKDATKNATEYEEALNLFTVTMGSKAQEATKWVEKFSKALYIDDSSLMQYMGSLNSLTKGLGVTSDKAYIMSKNLTQLVYDLSSFKNLDIETSFRKIQSAMSGEIEPLRNVGVALSQNTLQELANELGIQQRVAAMSEAQKAQLRYIQILRSTTEWQGDMARTLVSPANALRVLQQQFTLLGRAIGRMFIPFVMKAIPYIMALTQMITDLANKIAAFFGYKITDIDYSSLTDIEVAVGDIGDTADDTANKLNTMLAPFDELNVVQKQSQSSGSGLGALGGDLGLDLPEYDALAGLTKQMAENVGLAKKRLKDMVPIVSTIAGIIIGFKVIKTLGNVAQWLSGTGTALKSLSSFFGFKGKKAGINNFNNALSNTSGTAKLAKKTESSFSLPKWSTIIKGLGQLALVVTAVIAYMEVLGLVMKIPGFKRTLKDGTWALEETFNSIAKIAIPLAAMSAGVTVLGSISVSTMLTGLANMAVVILGTETVITAVGAIKKITGNWLNTGIQALKDVFNGIASIALPLTLVSAAFALTGLAGGAGTLAFTMGLANFAIIIGGTTTLLTAIGALLSLPNMSQFLNTGIDSMKKVFNGLYDIAIPLGLFTAYILVLGFATPAPILSGLAGFALIIGGLETILIALGALNQIPGFQWIVGDGSKVLMSIGNILGGFAGSIVDGFLNVATNSLPKIGEDLSNFMINARPFFEQSSNITADTMKGMEYLVNSLLKLTGENILDSLTSWFTGGSSLSRFGKELADFAPYFKRYSDEIKGVDSDVVKTTSDAVDSVMKFARKVPNEGGMIAWFTGDNKLGKFSEYLPTFGKNMKTYYNSIKEIDSKIISETSDVIESVIKFSRKVPNEGGMIAWFIGDNQLGKFSEYLPTFGKNMKKYYENVRDINTDIVSRSADVAGSIGEFARKLPNQGGIVSWFTGDNKLSTFGTELELFGSSLKSYYNNVKAIAIDKINSTTSAISDIVQNLKTIKDKGLNNTLKSFGESLSSSASGVSDFFRNTFSASTAGSMGYDFGSNIGWGINNGIRNTVNTQLSLKMPNGSKLMTLTVSGYANGGFPKAGEFFMANENGAEMVGKIGNRTAVANNDQITTSITNALVTALSRMDLGGGRGTTVVNIGTRKVFEGMGDYVDSENDRYGTNYVHV